ncbi:hypothetical protein HPB50_009108 [Hyalomma asiaticum]|uniref:Uncharacterized protein n=1 Tax=Hyalomma asiaticum TaxID=266040 RepID=A0ACB7T7L8_HYAAI|nr:hypothetical protein HPB50_009108 [Hyalomma asiaticum]
MAGAPKAIKVGIIGGSGLDNPDLMESRKEHRVSTPFGEAWPQTLGDAIEGQLPGQHLGAEADRVHAHYRHNRLRFPAGGYEAGQYCHPGPVPRQVLIKTVRAMNIPHHETGTVVTIEGPRFSTRAESCLFRSWNCHVINMTTVPEVPQPLSLLLLCGDTMSPSSNVVLAKEAGLLYAAIALVTDYDSWRLDVQHVDVEAVMETMVRNSTVALKVLRAALPSIAAIDWSAAIVEAQGEADRAVMK